jgi:hypothetical protein
MTEGSEVSNTGRARKRLLELCDPELIGIFGVEDMQAGIRAIVTEELYRRVHAASLGERVKHPMPAPEVVLAVRRDKLINNNLPRNERVLDFDIGKRYGIQIGGRVSEILYGDQDGNPVYDIKGVKIKSVQRRRKKTPTNEDM